MDILDQLIVDAQPAVPAEKQPIQKINYSHAAMIDLIIANPGISQNTLAARFGYTASWISQVISSDAFQAALAKRASEIVDPVLMMTVNERFDALVRRSQEILMEKLSKPPELVPDQLAIQTLAAASRARGYGARDTAPPPQGDLHVHLHDMGERLTTLLRKKKSEVIDVQVEEIAGASAEG